MSQDLFYLSDVMCVSWDQQEYVALSLSLSLSLCVCVHACARVCRFAGKIVGRSIAILRCVFLRGICVCLPSDHSTKEERTCGVAARAALNGLKLTAGATRVGNFLRVR